MTDIKQADAMMRMAHRDMTALHGMRDAAVFADGIFGFHVQQAIEKSLKAWMCALVLLRGAGIDVEAFWWTDQFTPYAHQARYEEGHLAEDAPLERAQILREVDNLLLQIEKAILALR